MSVVVYSKFLDKKKCSELLNLGLKEFVPDRRMALEDWHARNNIKESIKSKIYNIIKPICPLDSFSVGLINLTEYKDGRSLRPHVDDPCDYVFTIILSEGYVGGDFVVQNNTYSLKLGDCIVFNGSNMTHEVEKVTEGTRYAMSIMVTKSKTKLL